MKRDNQVKVRGEMDVRRQEAAMNSHCLVHGAKKRSKQFQGKEMVRSGLERRLSGAERG